MFPGEALKKKLEFANDSWSPLLIISVYNISDTVGKLLASPSIFLNGPLSIIGFFIRWIFVISTIVIGTGYKVPSYLSFIHEDWAALLNMFLVGTTNGFCNACHSYFSL